MSYNNRNNNSRPNYNRNKGGYNNNRRANNYFTQSIQRDGEDFIEKANPQKLKNDATRIFRDLAKGAVVVEDYYQYLANDKLLNAMEQVALGQFAKYSEVLNCINYKIGAVNHYGQSISNELSSIAQEYGWKVFVYEKIYYNLQNFKVTKDINYIIAMISQISNSRRYI